MVIFKQQIQAMNRVAIPKPIVDSLNLRVGDKVVITCDQSRIYITPTKPLPNESVYFDRGQGRVRLVSASGLESPWLGYDEKQDRIILELKKVKK